MYSTGVFMSSHDKQIKITVVDRLGQKGCHRGMRIGQTFDFVTQRGQMCPMVEHIAFIYADILRYGGNFGGRDLMRQSFAAQIRRLSWFIKLNL